MNKITCRTIIFLLVYCTSCTNQTNKPASTSGDKTVAEKKSQTAATYSDGKDYTLFERTRVTDNAGFTTPVEAYSILLPKGWSHNGQIDWVYKVQSPAGNGTYNNFKAGSADGKYSFEILPEITWNWVSDQQLLQLMQANTHSNYAFVAQPMSAEQYLRNVLINRELNGAVISAVQPNNAVVQEMIANFNKAKSELMMYGAADVQFYPSAINATVNYSNGESAIVLCGITIIESTVINQYNGSMQKSYTTSASKRIIFKYPTSEKQNAEKMFSVILGSVRTNTAWKDNVNAFWKNYRQQSNIANRQKIEWMDEQTRQIAKNTIERGNQRLKEMDMDLRSWEEGQHSQDKINTEFIKTIREVETYQDATGKVELSSGYDHAWSRGDGNNFILSNNPTFDPSSVFQDQNWQEMKVVK